MPYLLYLLRIVLNTLTVTEALPTVLHKGVVPVEVESSPELPPQNAHTLISSSLTPSILQDTGVCPQCKKQGKTYHHRRWDCIAWMGTKDGQVYAAGRRDRQESPSRSSVSRGRTASAQALRHKPCCKICKKTNHSDSQCWFRYPKQVPKSWTQSKVNKKPEENLISFADEW